MKTIMKTLLFTATICFAALLSTSAALASPPSPDSDPNCGGNCQAICINGCDVNAVTARGWYGWAGGGVYPSYSWQQARCVWTHQIGNSQVGSSYVTFDSKSGTWYCMDGYNCDSGPCGRDGERICNTHGTGCGWCESGFYNGVDDICHKLP